MKKEHGGKATGGKSHHSEGYAGPRQYYKATGEEATEAMATETAALKSPKMGEKTTEYAY